MFEKGDIVRIYRVVSSNNPSYYENKQDYVGKLGRIVCDKYDTEGFDRSLPCRFSIKLLEENRFTGWLWGENELMLYNNKRLEE